MVKQTILFIGSLALLILSVFFSWDYMLERADEGMTFDQGLPVLPIVEEVRVIHDEPVPISEIAPEPLAVPEPKSWPAVPFMVQAPTGEWGRSEFQNGCEEAATLMVSAWRIGKTYSKDEAKSELVAMARFQEKMIGQGVDTDANDTAALLLGEYFTITDYHLSYDFSLDDLKRALAEGLIIVPTNGQTLKNPNFTRPGPLQHMLVIVGYDPLAKEFITNDPGTRNGEGYRYAEDVLYAAIREYPTGKHLPVKGQRKAMIVIPEQSKP